MTLPPKHNQRNGTATLRSSSFNALIILVAIARMLLSPFRRPGRLRRSWLRFTLLFLLLTLCVDFLLTVTSDPPSTRVKPLPKDGSVLPKERIFIASMHWNNEMILRSHWSTEVLNVVRHYGAENVYVSIQESGSWDNTKDALRKLDLELGKLGVERSIVLDDTTHQDEIDSTPRPEGWIWTSRGKKELRRIPYLANIRNSVMEKLYELAKKPEGSRRFDKILWLNDVVFNTEDVTTLIATRGGDYAAACSLDFSKPPAYYDTFALRDISGAKAITQTWPFFLASESRNAMISNSPVPLKSCWNGIIVFQAEPFYEHSGLQFRGIPDSLALHHLEGSECCLIHADNTLTAEKGVWLNPNVRVSYNPEADKVVNPKDGTWLTRSDKVRGIWNNRWARLSGFPRRLIEQYVVTKRVGQWRRETKRKGNRKYDEKGKYCLINEMQVLVFNGWAHV